MKSVLLLMNNTQVGKRIEGGRVSRNLSSLPSHWLRVVLIAQAELVVLALWRFNVMF